MNSKIVLLFVFTFAFSLPTNFISKLKLKHGDSTGVTNYSFVNDEDVHSMN